MKRFIVSAAFVLGSFSLVNAEAVATPVIQGVATVIDGDTLEVHSSRIRLHGIDAPESSQTCIKSNGSSWRCGQAAALALADKIGRSPVRCEQRDIDRYGRIVAECFRAGDNLNRWLVRNGLAVAYRKYSTDYIDDEASARREKQGIWGAKFDMPWDWRKGSRQFGASNNSQKIRLLAQRSYSCSPRRTCSAIQSCDEASWYLGNCSWGGRLDRDNDGIPCESIC